MLWHNKITNELTTGNPWGHDGYFNPEKVSECYPDWARVEDDFVLPTPPEQPAEPEYVDPEKLAMAQAIADLYEQLAKLQGGNA